MPQDHPAARQAHTGTKIIVTGCFAARATAAVAALPGVVEVVPDKGRLPELLARWGLAEPPRGISHFRGRRRLRQGPGRLPLELRLLHRADRSPCAESSRPAGEVLDEVRRLVAHGHREIVLTGIHLGGYGNDECGEGKRGQAPFAGTARSALRTNGACPLFPHASSLMLDPLQAESASLAGLVAPSRTWTVIFACGSPASRRRIGAELIALMAERPERICPHLHLPLQSGSDAVLGRMNRRWPVGRFQQRCREIGAATRPPGADYRHDRRFSRRDGGRFCRHLRPGAGNRLCEGPCLSVQPPTGHARRGNVRTGARPHRGAPARELGVLAKASEERYLRGLLGRPLRVLVESLARDRPGTVRGRSDRYAPVVLPGGRDLIGQFVAAVAEDVVDGCVRGAAGGRNKLAGSVVKLLHQLRVPTKVRRQLRRLSPP